MADRVVAGLRRLGIEAERIVKESVDVALKERVRRVNEVCRELGTANVLLVSIHCNAAGNGQEWMKARGWSAYTTKGVTKADRLADCLYEEAEREFEGLRIRKDMSDGDPDWEENFYILKNTKCPAVLTENFFQDNEEDVAYLLSDEGKRAVTETHVKGIARYIDTLK
jgi:N-acetylmuramoyl-L-alanine amidase